LRQAGGVLGPTAIYDGLSSDAPGVGEPRG
jgi:hypothetical protein